MVEELQAVDHYDRYKNMIVAERNEHQEYRNIAESAVGVYEVCRQIKGKHFGDDEVLLPIVRNVIEVQVGAITGKRHPQAKISKRYDTSSENLCEVLELAANFFLEEGLVQNEFTRAFADALASGLGGTRIKYDSQISVNEYDQVQVDPITGEETILGVVEREELDWEKLTIERFEWSSFHWEPCKRWTECGWIAFKHTPTIAEFEKSFEMVPDKVEPTTDDNFNYSETVDVYEIWDKERNKRVYYSDKHSEIILEEDNPLNTDYFYPMHEPMFYGMMTETYEPRPELHFWREMHTHIQQVQANINALTKGVVDVEFFEEGIFNQVTELKTAKHGDKIPLDISKLAHNNSSFDINKYIVPKDHSSRVAILDKLEEKLDQAIAKVERYTGIADIMQQQSNPHETLGSQEIKQSWGGARLAPKRFMFTEHVRGTIEIMVNTMVKLLQPDTISQAAGRELSAEERQTLETMDDYRIEVDTLATLTNEKEAEQKNVMEMVRAGTEVSVSPVALPLKEKFLQMLAKVMPDGRELESVIPDAVTHMDANQQLQQQLQQMQQQLAEVTNQNRAMANRLNNVNQAEEAKDIADARKSQAEAEKKEAETQKIIVETTQAAAPVVAPDVLLDEQAAYQLNRQPINVNYQ